MPDICAELDALDTINFEKNRFIPLNKLRRLFTKEKIQALLEQNEVEIHLRTEATNAVMNNGHRLFATLASIRSIKLFGRFLTTDSFSESQFDSKLPLSKSGLADILQDPKLCDAFFERQWRFLVPVFQDGQAQRELSEWTILPFIDRKKIGGGGFSVVYKVKVDASHHKIAGFQGELELICKQLSMRDSEEKQKIDFENEVQILSFLRCLDHPNIIRLITAYTKGEEHNFLLPVASGDLHQLLLSLDSEPYFSTTDAILNSLWGLSSAIEAVHDFFAAEYKLRKIGCHYDIKPKNILCLENKLILSDFGLSRLRSEADGSRSLFKQGEGSYMAPECEPSEKDFKPGLIGRPSDIWSFGCVISEILAYLSAESGRAPEKVTEFRQSRKIKLGPLVAYHFHSVDGINPAVVAFLDKHVAEPSSPAVFKSLALLVQRILQFEPQDRPKAATITRQLFHITQRNIVNKIRSNLETCLGNLTLDMQIELWRLKIWAKAVGLESEPEDIQPAAWLAKPHSYQEYQSTQAILDQCLIESGNIVVQLQNNSRPPYKVSYYIQRRIDSLWDIQPIHVRRSMTSRLEEIVLDSKSILHLLDGYQQNAMDIRSSSSSEEDYSRISYLATMKEVAAAMTAETYSNQDFSMEKSCLGPPVTRIHNHVLKTMNESNQRVLIEIMEYQDAWVSRIPELIQRVNAIASLLNRDAVEKGMFPVLKCKGYYHDVPYPQFGIIYELPSFARNTDPMNLIQIIEGTQSRSTRPSLTTKFELASSLVSHVLDFHLGGWLHKNICSFNIICFPEVFDSLADSLSSPYFVGFNHCRLNNESAFTVASGAELEYQHPAYLKLTKGSYNNLGAQAPRFQQEFDYYSVGLVLMEIAFWKSLKDVTRKIEGTPEQLVEELLRTHVPMVRTYMGDSYGNAVETCLTCYKGVDGNGEVARETFRRSVVVPINEHDV